MQFYKSEVDLKLSVLMSVYAQDDKNYFEIALKSITSDQILKPQQVVLVQDGSVSKAIDHIIKKIENENSDIRFDIIRLKNNSGLAVALNIGLKVCECDWIARMDADDIALPDRFMKQARAILTDTTLDVIGSAVNEFRKTPGDLNLIREGKKIHCEIEKMARRRNPMNHMSVIYRKQSVLSVGGYPTNFGKIEDYALWIKMIINGAKFANMEEVLVYVRVGNGFLERRSNHQEIQDWDRLQDYMIEHHFISKKQKYFNKLCIRGFIYMPNCLKVMAYRCLLRK